MGLTGAPNRGERSKKTINSTERFMRTIVGPGWGLLLDKGPAGWGLINFMKSPGCEFLCSGALITGASFPWGETPGTLGLGLAGTHSRATKFLSLGPSHIANMLVPHLQASYIIIYCRYTSTICVMLQAHIWRSRSWSAVPLPCLFHLLWDIGKTPGEKDTIPEKASLGFMTFYTFLWHRFCKNWCIPPEAARVLLESCSSLRPLVREGPEFFSEGASPKEADVATLKVPKDENAGAPTSPAWFLFKYCRFQSMCYSCYM